MLSCRPTATRAVQDGILDGHHSACEPPVGGRCGTVGRRLLTTLRAHRNAAEKGRHLARFFFEAFRRSLEQAMPREHGFHSRFECSLGSSSCWHQSLCPRLLRLMFPSMVSSPADRVLQILPDPLCVCHTLGLESSACSDSLPICRRGIDFQRFWFGRICCEVAIKCFTSKAGCGTSRPACETLWDLAGPHTLFVGPLGLLGRP